MPVAEYCKVAPKARVAFAGVTAIDDKVALFTVRANVPVMPLSEALMVVVPAATEVTTPELLMVATAVLLEVQMTPANVKVLPSE